MQVSVYTWSTCGSFKNFDKSHKMLVRMSTFSAHIAVYMLCGYCTHRQWAVGILEKYRCVGDATSS